MRLRKGLSLSLALAFAAGAPRPAGAQLPFGIGGSTEITQLLNHAQLVLVYARQAQQIARQAQQIANQVQAIKMLTREGMNLSSIPAIASMTAQDIFQIQSMVKATQGISTGLAANDSMFRNVYQTYSATTNSGIPFYQAYGGWTSNTLNILQSLAKVAGAQQDQVLNEQSMNMKLQQMMATPQGTDATLEKLGVLSFTLVRQMQNLRMLMAQDTLSKSAFNGYMVAKDQAATNDGMKALAYAPRDVDHTQFGNVPGATQ